MICNQNSCRNNNLLLSLQCVFHSIRFKVNKVGVRRYSFFYAFKSVFIMKKHYLMAFHSLVLLLSY